MPVPNHPPKHESTPIVTPDQTPGTHPTGDQPIPNSVVLTYSTTLYEYLTDTHDGTRLDHYYGDLHVLSDTVGVLGNFGIGAPTTAMLMEELIAAGVETFLSIGYAGALDQSIDLGDYIVCEKAIRDDGTSHHYLEPSTYTHPTPTLNAHVLEELDRHPTPHHVGPSWTIDAVYRETEAEVAHYANDGVLTVEMEAAAVFAVATHHNIEAASVFVVSDYLTTEDWTPHFDAAITHLKTLGDMAIDILATFDP